MIYLNTYNYYGDGHVIDKSAMISPYTIPGTSGAYIAGVFRGDVDQILTPDFEIEYPEQWLGFNYVEWAVTGTVSKYYYVRSWERTVTGMIVLHLELDRRFTFMEHIWSHSAILERYQANESPMIPDPLMPFTDDPTVSGYSQNIPYADNPIVAANGRGDTVSWAVTFAHSAIASQLNYDAVSDGVFQQPSGALQPEDLCSVTYLMDRVNLERLLGYILSDDWSSIGKNWFYGDSKEWVINVVAFPFNLLTISGYVTPAQQVSFGPHAVSGCTGYLIDPAKLYPRISLSTAGATELLVGMNGDYRDLGGYSSYSLLVPLLGYTDIPASDMIKCRDYDATRPILYRWASHLRIDYLLDLQTGTGTVVISDPRSGHQQILKMLDVQLGTPLSLTRSDALQFLQNTINKGASALMSMAVAATAPQAGSAAVGATGATAGAAATFALGEQGIIYRGQTSSTNTALMIRQDPVMTVYTRTKAEPTDYASLVGYPSHKTHSLRSLNGWATIRDIHLRLNSGMTLQEHDALLADLRQGCIYESPD